MSDRLPSEVTVSSTGMGLRLLCGRVYVVVQAEWESLCAAGLSMLLAADPSFDRVWITRRDPERELAVPNPLLTRVRNAAINREIRICSLANRPSAVSARILDELDGFGLAGSSLVVIDGAERLLMGDNEMSAMRHWAEQRACTLVFLCMPDSVGEFLASLRPVADRLAGLARLRRTSAGLWWDTLHWFGAQGFVGNRTYRVATDKAGTLLLKADESHPDTHSQLTGDDVVLVLRPAVTALDPAASHWRLFDDLDALIAASGGLPAATIVLPMTGDTVVDNLARAVFELRRAGGPQRKIVVRESEIHLRHSQEQLLLRVGANLVIPSEVGFSRLLSLVETVQGQVFAHPIPDDYPAALTDVVPDSMQGYVPPAKFIDTVERILQQSENLGIQNALVHLPLPLGMSARAALSFCSMARPGDLSTVDDKSLYLFLFACREYDVDLALDRLFDIPVTELFEGETRSLSATAIRQATAALAARLADYSDLEGIADSAALENSEAPAHESLDDEALLIPFATAVRRPLVLRVGVADGAEVA